MSLSGLTSASLNMSQTQEQWDAIAEIKSTSVFATATDAQARNSSAAETLDAILPGYGLAATAALSGGSSDETLAEITARVRAAEQTTIDLYA
ncbi:MAG: hypothetical protein QM679_10845 [Patulibacter sp.]